VPAISPCRRVGEEEEAGEVDADVEVEAQSRQAVGDAISISDRAKQKRYTVAAANTSKHGIFHVQLTGYT
jgi:hypothetical protein